MKLTALFLGALACLLLAGCSSSDNGNTTDAAKDVAASSAKGGNMPDPNLPKPMGGPPPGGGAPKTGKFRPATLGGG